jgi:2-oxoisovalerate dehydrogenase E1 component
MTSALEQPAGGEAPLLEIYRLCRLTRAVDERLWILSRQGRAGFVLTGRGHEVAQVASALTLRLGSDWAWPYYRDLAVGLALGVTPYQVFLGALARAEDPHSGGRQLSMHFSSAERRIGSVSSEVGAHLPHAAGAAYAARVRGEGTVSMCWFGDGASSEGAAHEAMNFAAVHRLGVVFVCENNGWSISVPQSLQMAVPSVADRAPAYGMKGWSVDGTDPEAVWSVVAAAVARARAGEGPSLVEVRVSRTTPHSSQDDDAYRSEAERAALVADDPVLALASRVVEHGLISKDEDEAEWAAVRAEVLAAQELALAAPEPEPDRARRWLWAGDAAGRRPAAGRASIRPAPAETPSVGDGEPVTMVEAVRDALAEEMARDGSVVLMGQDVGRKGGVFKASVGLLDEFGPLRVMDTPVAEIGIAGVAVGAAMAGLRPVAEFQFADYIHPAYDQIVNQAATVRWRSVGGWGVPAVFRAPCGAGVRGGVYHSQSVEAAYCHVPGLKVVMPATPADAKGLLKAAIRDDDPVVFFEPKRAYRSLREPVGTEAIPLGVARVDRTGDDVSLVTYGIGVHLARAAVEALEVDGLSVEIVDLRTLVPYDREAVARTVAKTGRLLVLHEANRTMGFGAEIAALAAEELFADLDAPVVRIGADDCHIPYNGPEEDAIIPDAEKVVDAVRRLAAF